MKLEDFDTLADAQAYEYTEDKKQVGSGQARGFFVNTGIWTALKAIQADIANPLFALADAVIVTASDASSYFGLDESTAEGQGNIAGAQVLVDAGLMTDTQRIEFLNKRYRKTKPFENATQEEFDTAKYVPVKIEVTYLDAATYIITTGNQGIDVQLTNISVDGTFELYLDTCADSADQSLDASYIPYAGGQAVARVTSKNGVAQFSLSNRKVRQYNRLYVKALHDCTYDALAVTNRG